MPNRHLFFSVNTSIKSAGNNDLFRYFPEKDMKNSKLYP